MGSESVVVKDRYSSLRRMGLGEYGLSCFGRVGAIGMFRRYQETGIELYAPYFDLSWANYSQQGWHRGYL